MLLPECQRANGGSHEKELAWMPTQRDSRDATGRVRSTASVVNRQPIVAIKFNFELSTDGPWCLGFLA